MIIVYTVTGSLAEAEKIGMLLLDSRLCACVNIIPGMKSMYRWQGKIEQAQEVVLLIKTEKEKYEAVESLVKREHSYETPAIFALDAERVELSYAHWLKNEIK